MQGKVDKTHVDGPRTDSISEHILPTAATMVGVCVTLVGLIKITEAKTGPSRVDECAAVVALVFLLSAILSYFSLRGGLRNRYRWALERIADAVFIFGLVAIGIVATLFAYEII